ncbi:Hypothetical predicted protein [Olea europaea subsp. europaea]|uniref:J domain-containing protein n=1 Tax=Olea europaea subsp. europaea TaxID=158383 RepID=A0A8S0RHP4_OLEEU|nr:Hypothetical predicted protein [Olea europaea subsp. europaea]
MQVIPRWRNILALNNPIIQSTWIATPSTAHLANFHSTDVSFEKWKNKWNPDVSSQQPSKANNPSQNYIRYAVRQKRADAKKALKNLIFNGGCSKSTAEETFHHIEAECEDQYNKKSRIKPARQARRAYHKKIKRKLRRDNMFEDFDAHPERIFQATFGKRCFTWTFKPWEMGFDWRENFSWNDRRYEEHDTKGGTEFTSGSTIVGTYSDRITLGLPPAGPLKIEDVKTAFRSSALKWHPDKHQGPSQADAEEKFKHCVNAYKSLCIALSTSA